MPPASKAADSLDSRDGARSVDRRLSVGSRSASFASTALPATWPVVISCSTNESRTETMIPASTVSPVFGQALQRGSFFQAGSRRHG